MQLLAQVEILTAKLSMSVSGPAPPSTPLHRRCTPPLTLAHTPCHTEGPTRPASRWTRPPYSRGASLTNRPSFQPQSAFGAVQQALTHGAEGDKLTLPPVAPDAAGRP